MTELCGKWTAIHDFMPPGAPKLTVSGDVCFTEGGWSAHLLDHEGPQGINPEILIIDLVFEENGAHTEQATRLTVSWKEETASHYEEVSVQVRNGSANGMQIPVEIVN